MAKKFIWLSKNKRHTFHFHQELYWTMYSLAERTFWPTQRTSLQWARVANGWMKFGLTKLGWGQLTKDQQGPAEHHWMFSRRDAVWPDLSRELNSRDLATVWTAGLNGEAWKQEDTTGRSPAGTEAADSALAMRLEEGPRSRVISLPALTGLVIREWGQREAQGEFRGIWLGQLAAVKGLERGWAEEDTVYCPSAAWSIPCRDHWHPCLWASLPST